ncbi:MAG: serine/threonine-protein phosphatase [Actinobacteria bacterium]|nr:serine/threonine-protein phosphatase [Actinomycetota bacterium]
MALALRYAARSDVGMVRRENEDSGYASPRLLVIADGMGGHAAGELASATAVATLAEVVDGDGDPGETLASLAAGVHAAGASIGQVVIDNPDLVGMGTTTTALSFIDEGTTARVAVVHVGDSRGYLLRGGDLTRITHDHTYVQTLIDAGRISEDEASVHPRRSLIMRAIDGLQPADPDLSVIEARASDRFLLCSDGLTGVVADDELRSILADTEPTATVIALVDLALARGAPDNVTVVVADVLEVDGQQLADLTGGEAVVVGAAGEPRVRARLPRVHFPKDAQVDPDAPDRPARVDGPPTSEMPTIKGAAPLARSAGGNADRQRIWTIVAAVAAAVIAIIVAVGIAGTAWVRSQWYVGQSDGLVTIYRGVSGSLLGLPMQSTVQVSDLTVGSLPLFDAGLVADGIVADSEADAQRIVNDLRVRAAACAVVPTPAGCPAIKVTP